MKALTVAWLIPGVSLTWIGFASSGIRTADAEVVRRSLEQTQAFAVMLVIFYAVVCAIWALRTWDHLPSVQPGRIGSPILTASHACAGIVAIGTMIVAESSSSPHRLMAIAAFCGFGAALISLRAVSMAPVFRPATLCTFAAAMLFQITIGWLHLLDPTGPFAVTLIAQGLLLAWTAIAAAREFGAVQRAVRLERSAQQVVSQEPALRPLPEPAAGH